MMVRMQDLKARRRSRLGLNERSRHVVRLCDALARRGKDVASETGGVSWLRSKAVHALRQRVERMTTTVTSFCNITDGRCITL